MIDTHCHLIPGIDDGAQNDEDALDMARVALEDGVHTICCTPHMKEGEYMNERPKVLEGVAYLRELFKKHNVKLRVEAGSEIHLGPRMAERVNKGRLLSYADKKKHVLLELPFRMRPLHLEEQIFEMRMAGLTTVLAHPERIHFFLKQPEKYEQLIQQGCLAQMTTGSLMGQFGKDIQKISESWVRRGLVHILASDAHDARHRPPKLATARARWVELAGEDSAERATVTYPNALLTGESIAAPEPREIEPPRGLFARIFGR